MSIEQGFHGLVGAIFPDPFAEEDLPPRRFTKEEYQEYLKSPEWDRIRSEAIEEAGKRCRGCDTHQSLEVHHRTYERVGRERLEDLTVLCDQCHIAVHIVADERRGVVR